MSDLNGFTEEELFMEVYNLCKSKAEEFEMLGYDNVSPKDIWECVASSYKEFPALHKLVNDILSLKTTKYMNWQMMKVYRNNS
ncbi:post-transcriptional regulator [Brevibacillus migulae]|uniref:post-transcriptional regulator n=1 Tax=Brevibacillus migulae TaxID=1644114 RepID=UPI00196AFE33|nr:post-transcriptional regulator [Brevibacillus migulae]